MDTSRLADLLRSQNFGPNDSQILSAINHPLIAAQKGADWFAGQVSRAANIPSQQDMADNPYPFAGYTPEQQVGGALNLAGLAQTGAYPLAPQGAGTLGTITKFEKAHQAAQRNAALPVEQGGLGLPANNTAMDRAKAMGYELDQAELPDLFNTKLTKKNVKGFPVELQSNLIDFTSALSDAGIPYKYNPSKSTNSAYISVNSDPYMTYKGNPTISEQQIRFSDHSKDIKKIFSKHLASDEFLADVFSPTGHTMKDALDLINTTPGLRSRFAAFDPMQINSPNILAGGALGALLLNQEYNKDRQ